MKKIILIGGFSEVIELCETENIQIVGIIDNYKKGDYMGYQILGTDDNAVGLYNSYGNIPLIITPDSSKKRSLLVEIYRSAGYTFTNLISSNSTVSKSAEIGNGVFIQCKVNVSAHSKIGDFVRVNTMANIMHDNSIGEYSIVGPNAVLLGDVKIGSHCYIGANSTILPHKNIGNNVIIGAGAVVTKDVLDNKVMVGNPARELIVK